MLLHTHKALLVFIPLHFLPFKALVTIVTLQMQIIYTKHNKQVTYDVSLYI